MIAKHHTYDNFLTFEQLEMIQEAIFKHYDLDKDGFLEKYEVLKFMEDALLGGEKTEEEIKNIALKFFIEADKNRDGKVSRREFIEVIKNLSELSIISAERQKMK